MKLTSIQIKNYRSISDLSLDINPLDDGTFTYGLIGVNETGKSSILKALALKEVKEDGIGLITITSKDFKDKANPIEVFYYYQISPEELTEIKKKMEGLDPPVDSKELEFNKLVIKIAIDLANPSQRNLFVEIRELTGENKSNIEIQIKQFVLEKSYKSIFWTAEDRYLIAQPVNLSDFASAPENISIPLKNCFTLAGIKNVPDKIARLAGDSTEVELLENELGGAVTKHIKTVWPNHPIKITFKIDGGLINFHVQDIGTNEKAKTADQRSDGFKQFISFLFTVSAQDKNNELSNSILLLDEPEAHLHPEAQEYLLNELIKITQNGRNNIVFFATHSIFMIDKKDLSRNYRVKKDKNNTALERLNKINSTYSSTIYDVFGIPTADYHCELYSKLHNKYIEDKPSDPGRTYIKNFDNDFLSKAKKLPQDKPWRGVQNKATLPTFVRNCIDHPSSSNIYSKGDLIASIKVLKELAVQERLL